MGHFAGCDPRSCSCETRRYAYVLAIGLVLVAAQFTSGRLLGSLALQSDAYHHLGDSAGFAVSLAAAGLLRKRPDRFSAPLRVFAGAIVAGLLFFAGMAVIHETAEHLVGGAPPRNGFAVAALAAISAYGNHRQHQKLHAGHHEEAERGMRHWNERHVVLDLIQNVAVVGTGLVAALTAWWFVDPIVSGAIGIRMMWEPATAVVLRGRVACHHDHHH